MKIDAIVSSLGALSKKWLKPSFRFRRLAVRRLVRKSGFAPKAAEVMLDALFRELTAAKLRALLRAEIGNPRRLDGELRGPHAITHVLSGNVPNPGVQSMIHGLLVKSFNYVKPSSRDEGIVDIYLGSLRAHNRKLAAFYRLLKPSDRAGLGRAISESDLVIAYGSDASVAAVLKMAGPKKKFAGYGHRVSFSIVTRLGSTRAAAEKSALDVWMMDRRGCLSPSVIFLEESKRRGGFVADTLLRLAKFEKYEGKTRADWARAVSVRRQEQEARMAGDFFRTTPKRRYFARVSRSLGAGWGEAPGADIRLFRRIEEVYKFLSPYKAVLQAAALECAPGERAVAEKKLRNLGFNRICRAGALQFPPVTWKHDGRPNFSGWLTASGGKITR